MKIIGLLFLSLIYACSLKEATDQPPSNSEIQLIQSFPLKVPEPSGLTINSDQKSLWMVSDRTGKIYLTNLQGQILKTLSFIGNDLEGITQDSRDHTLWVAEEQKRELVHLDTLGNELDRHKIAVENRSPNSGLEGLTIDAAHGQMYVVNEKNPRLFLILNPDFSIQHSIAIDFTDDCSGLFYASSTGWIWMVSDASQSLVCMDSLARPLHQYYLGIQKAEGIAVDAVKHMAYIVSDSESKLYWFGLPQAE